MPDYSSLIGAIDSAEASSYGSDEDGDLSTERARNIDAYLGKNNEPAPDGRSQVVDRSVYETVQWIKPSLARIFANGDDVVDIPPVGPDDEAGAKQEAEFLNYVVLQRNNWFEIFDTASSDALLTKAGYLYPYREKRRQVEVERYERQTPESVALILEDGGEITESEEYPDPDYKPPPPQPMMQMGPMGQPVPVMDPMTGQPVMQPEQPAPMLYDITVRRTREEVKYCILVLPPERCKVAKTCTTVQVRDADYFEYYDFPTLSELREMGYDVPDDLADGTEDSDTEEDVARDQYSENAFATDEHTDPASKRVKCRWIWIKHDYDQDGIAERQHVVRVSDTILHREEVGRVPVGVLCPDPMAHRHVGLCPADVTLEIQRQKTAILRQGLDNLYLSNNPRTFATTNVNLDDLLVSRPGGIVRGKAGAQFGIDIAPLAVPFVFPQAMEGLAYMDSVRDMRAGVNRNFTGLNEEALGANQSGVAINQLSTMAAQRVEQIARHFAAGISETFSILHEIILRSGHKAETVKLRGGWVQINPAEWRRRTDFKISVGYAAGNKDALVQRLMMIAAQQLQAIQLGLPIVQPRNVYETNIELAKAADMSTPERFFTDPATVPPPGPPQPDPTLVAIEQLKTQSAEKLKVADIQSTEKIKAAELDMDKYKVDTDANVKLTLANQQLQAGERMEHVKGSIQAGLKRMDGEHTEKIERQRSQHTLRLAKAKGVEVGPEPEDDVTREEAEQIQQQIGQLSEAVQQLAQVFTKAITAQKRIRRGKDGRPEGVDLVDSDGQLINSQRLLRGPDGRVAGSA
jgi:hypothetical protein